MVQKINIWKGVYPRLSDVPRVGLGYNSPTWLENSVKQIKGESPKILGQKPGFFLPIVRAVYPFHQKMGIIDFGGGVGLTFRDLIQKVPIFNPKQYIIVENSRLAHVAREHWGDQCPGYVESINDVHIKPDIILARSSLHYVEDWREVLGYLLKLKPGIFCLEDVPLSEGETFATSQNYYESTIPAWFFNEEELLSVFGLYGYEAAFIENLNSLTYSDGSKIEIKGAKIRPFTKMYLFLPRNK